MTVDRGADDETGPKGPTRDRRYDTYGPHPKIAARHRDAVRRTHAERYRRLIWRRAARVAVFGSMVAVALSAAYRAWLVPWTATSREMPPSLIGTWTTDDQAYAGRLLTIRARIIEVRIPDATGVRYFVGSVRQTEAEGRLRFRIRARDAEGAPISFEIRPSGAQVSAFEFGNRPGVVWKRAKATG